MNRAVLTVNILSYLLMMAFVIAGYKCAFHLKQKVNKPFFKAAVFLIYFRLIGLIIEWVNILRLYVLSKLQ